MKENILILALFTLLIVGSNIPNKIIDLCKNHKNCTVVGYVENLAKFLDDCKVMVAPLRFGAGIKGKITFSMINNLPIVTTSIGAEGMALGDANNCMISNNPTALAKKAIEVYTDEHLWNQLSKNGLIIAKEYFPERTSSCIIKMISSIIKD